MDDTVKRKGRAVQARLLKSADVARMLGDEPDTFRSRVRGGADPEPFARRGNLYYYRRADVEYFLEHGRWPAGMTFRGHGASGSAGAAGPTENPAT